MIYPPGVRACLRMALVLGLLAACGDTDRPAGLVDAGRDASVSDVPAQCVSNLQCDDGVACTVDTCAAGRCVRVARADLCPSGSACDATRGCLPRRACVRDADCADEDRCTVDERCDTAARYCVFGTQPDGVSCGDPAQARSCRGGVCSCPSDRPATCGDRCVSLQSDPSHCGACGVACGAGSWCDQGQCACSLPQRWCPSVGCVDLSRDLMNCGTCGNACSGNARCEMGRCVTPCPPNSHRCGDACLADNLPASCGTRCAPCPTPENSRSTCEGEGADAVCSFICSLGFHRCDNRCAANNDVATCGDRCAPCPAPANGVGRCVEQRCDIACNPGYHACNGQCADNASPASCGDRCAPCPTPENGVATCVAGQCGFTCQPGYRMCNGACTDGSSPLGCGPSCTRCAVPTNGRALCVANACTFACNTGFHACGSGCASDLAPETCGSRCTPCPVPAHARGTCEEGQCGFVCDAGYVRAGSVCQELPRHFWPPSGAWVSSQRPRFRWRLPADVSPTAPDTDVQVCRDRACASVVASFSAADGERVSPTDLPRGALFWRVRARGVAGPAWEVTVTGRGGDTAPAGLAWGTSSDFDGDGYSDLAGGAPFLGMPGNRVYAFRGSPMGVITGGRVTLDAPDPGGQFGFATAAAGDVNGDGFADLVVGAPALLNNTGRAYVYFGSARGLHDQADVTLQGPDGADAYFGAAVGGGGDFNRDGYADVVVGANRAGMGGRVHVYYGGPDGPAPQPSLTLQGPPVAFTRFGIAVANAGDLDGDGDSDLLVGADGYDSFGGRLYVFAGGPTGLSPTPRTLDNPQGGQFASAVAGVGDVNGDGFPDVAAGATTLDAGRGQLVVYYGAPMGLSAMASVAINGPDAQMGDFGGAVAPAGDIDGDGYGDLVTSAARLDDFTGRAYLYRGGPMGVVTDAPQRLENTFAPRGFFGGALVGARDFDNDGFSDIAVAAERATTFTGVVTVYRGSATGLSRATSVVGPDGVVSRFGFSLASRAAPVCGPRS